MNGSYGGLPAQENRASSNRYVVLPLIAVAFLLCSTRFYKIGVLGVGSWLIILVAGLWLFQRAFDVLLPGLSFLTPS